MDNRTWVLFDLDGTLTRSEEGIWNCVRYAADKLGLATPDAATLWKFIGPPLQFSFREYMGLSEEMAEKAVETYRERYGTVGMFENRVFPGVRRMLRTLRKEGFCLGIVTGKPAYATHEILKHFDLYKFFDAVSCATDGHADKDALILQALPGEHGEVWMVGDRCFDMEGGRKTGVHTLGVTFGYGSEEELREAGAEMIAHTVDGICEILCPDAGIPEGAFLSMEGLDGSGKGTQLELLTDVLDRFGFDVVRSREPGGSPIGEKIREILLDRADAEMSPETEALLFAASRAQHVREVIRPAIAAGKVLLCDRFVDSSVAYQGGGRQLGVERVLAINAPAVDGTLPLVTVYLDLDHQTSLSRRCAASEPDRLELEAESFHARVEEAYHELIRRDPERFVSVDATGSREEIAAKVAEAVLARLTEAEK